MTRRTELEAALTAAVDKRDELARELQAAVSALKRAGYEKREARFGTTPPAIAWEISERRIDADYAEQQKIHNHFHDKGFAAGKREALELVLNALEIKYPGYTGVAEHFEKDLRTALEVRVQRTQSARDAATEARVAGLAKKSKGDKK